MELGLDIGAMSISIVHGADILQSHDLRRHCRCFDKPWRCSEEIAWFFLKVTLRRINSRDASWLRPGSTTLLLLTPLVLPLNGF